MMAAQKSEIVIEPEVAERYRIGQLLGRGAYGIVFQGICLSTGREVAIKFISKAKIGASTDKVEKEIAIMKSLDHPRILRMLRYISTKEYFVIVLEKVDGGELLQQMLKVKKYTERKACRVIYNLLRALKHMHERHWMHCDLKPENLLLVKAPINDEEVTSIKLADFGLARSVKPSELPNTACGSPMYIAPEVLQAGIKRTRLNYNEKADLWSVGVITYLLVSGMIPFYAPTPQEIFQIVLTTPHSLNHPSWDPISAEAKDFVNRLLTKDPDHRPSAAEALSHPWMQLCNNPDDDDDVDLPSTLEGLRKFNAQQKLKGAMYGVEATFRMAYLSRVASINIKPNSNILQKISQPPECLSTIDLSGNYLGAKGLLALCDTLTSASGVTTLNLTNVILTDDQLDKLIPYFLRPTSSITTLICDSNDLTHTGGRILFNLARGRPSFLRITADNNRIKQSILAKLAEQCKLNRNAVGLQ